MKQLVASLITALAAGDDNGLSPFGHILERLGNHAVFLTRELRHNFECHRLQPAPSAGEIPPPGAIVYDVGANNGDDIEYYLKKGCNVVGIEANPALARRLAERFATEISSARVAVLNLAIINDDRASINFFVNDGCDKVSTSVEPAHERHKFHCVQVAARRLSDVIAEHGPPYYVKIDVEGRDAEILRDLFEAGERPALISAEVQSIQVLTWLLAAGYQKFKVVEGRFLHLPSYAGPFKDATGETFDPRFPMGSVSGPFGDDLPGSWLDADQVFDYLARYGLGWKDLHASRDKTSDVACP